jgi:DNA-binding transcriptional LysR family regulator
MDVASTCSPAESAAPVRAAAVPNTLSASALRLSRYLRPHGRLDCSDGQVLHAWCSSGLGLAWRSAWEVEQEIAAGELVSVLDDFAAPPNGIYAVFPHARHLALRVRLWIDFLKHSYGDAAYWRRVPLTPT